MHDYPTGNIFEDSVKSTIYISSNMMDIEDDRFENTHVF